MKVRVTVLCQKLVDRGYDVRALARATADRKGLFALRVELAEGDVTDPPSLPLAVRDVEIIFHLARIRPAASRDAFYRVNAEGTRNLGEAALESGARPLVLCGSLAINRKLARQLLAPAWTFSTEKARQLLDFRPATSLQDSIKRSTAWYQRSGWI